MAVVKKIPKGKMMTYASVAKRAGSPKASRVIGSILKKISILPFLVTESSEAMDHSGSIQKKKSKD
ncbi:MAG: hypothetical protein AUK19_03030 [Candidatus Moranbacteria bacterium CG2_30_45_14]|nr:MAG: hypothetical protein AUK19_03030 [Candidatus Moranbacteria bacterium CG2_30_45_14]